MMCWPYRSTAQPGAGTVVIRENGTARRQHRLFPVVLGHLLAGCVEILHDPGIALLVQRERQAERFAHRFPRQIVRRGTEPRRSARSGRCASSPAPAPGAGGRCCRQPSTDAAPVADNRQLLRQKLAVGVEYVPEQQFGAHGDDFCVHVLTSCLSKRLLPEKRAFSRPSVCGCPSSASFTKASISSAVSASSSCSGRGRVRGCRGVKTVQRPHTAGWRYQRYQCGGRFR